MKKTKFSLTVLKIYMKNQIQNRTYILLDVFNMISRCFIVFLFFNIILSPTALGIINSYLLGSAIFINDEDFSVLWLFPLSLLLTICRFTFLPVFYKIIGKNNLIFVFLNNFKNVSFSFKFLLFILFIDLISVFLTLLLINVFSRNDITINPDFFACFLFWTISWGGLFITYLSLIIWFKLKNIKQINTDN